jgi:VWFA-related protein
MGRVSVAAAIASSLAFMVSAQRGAPVVQQPVFRTSTDLIQVDTVVVDKDGKTVRGLTKEDFEILDNGKTQSVVALNEFHHDRTVLAVTTDVAGNSAERLVVLVLDDKRPSPQKKDIARAFVRALAGHAQMALVRTSTEPGVEFTSNAQALLDALDAPPTVSAPFAVPQSWTGPHLSGLSPELSPGRSGPLAPTRMLPNTDFGAVRDRSLSANDGRRKVFVVISEGEFNDGVGRDFLMKDAQKNAEGKRSQKGLLDDLHKRFTQLLQIAERSNSAIYAVNPRETAATPASPDSALVALTARSGGYSLGPGESLSSNLDRVMEEVNDYYVLGFSPTDRRTQTHTIEVKVRRSDFTVRHRKQYGLDDPARERALKASEKDPLLGLAYSPVSTGEIPLRAWATITTPSPGTIAAPIALWLDTGDARIDEYGVFVINMNTNKESVKPVGRSLVGLPPSPFPLEAPALPPGSYQLRVAARSADAGRGGSVYLAVRIPDFTKTPLAITGLLLGNGNTRRPDLGSLPFVPTLERTFDATTRLRVAFDVWRKTPASDAHVFIEIVNSEGTTALRVHDATLATSDRHINTPVTLTGLAPGLYTLRITATSGATRAQQEIGFQLR